MYKRLIREAKQFFRLDLNLINISQYVSSTSINELRLRMFEATIHAPDKLLTNED